MAVHRSDTAQRAMPPWTEVEATLDVVCKLCERLDDVFPVAELDVVVVGIFHQVSVSRALDLSCVPTAGSWLADGASKAALVLGWALSTHRTVSSFRHCRDLSAICHEVPCIVSVTHA